MTAALVHTVNWDPYDYPPTLEDAALALAHDLPGKPLSRDEVRAGMRSTPTALGETFWTDIDVPRLPHVENDPSAIRPGRLCVGLHVWSDQYDDFARTMGPLWLAVEDPAKWTALCHVAARLLRDESDPVDGQLLAYAHLSQRLS
ncbi:hypothetical protein AB0F46_28640 [Streptomyces sp. NPDC026665]|uniref:hypothetical protein n=1 Tax=Streptomyces sp. NPDC026665 TaxID=3154798 RepID=UPI0033C49791